MDLCLAIDIGGTKLAAGLVSGAGDLYGPKKVETPRDDDPDTLFAALVALVDGVLGDGVLGDDGGPGLTGANLAVCGVGCGGPMDLERGTVSPLNIPAWRDFPLRARLEEATGLMVALDNDAKAFALAEGWTGAARHQRDFLAMVVSTPRRRGRPSRR